ncbi:MAG TPA: hypothetical protein VGO93_13190 [Candidatus Xenobia bacterium]|jgi:hypothetical protein
MAKTSKKLEIVYRSTIKKFRPYATVSFLVALGIFVHAIVDIVQHPHHATPRIEAMVRIPVSVAMVGITLYIFYSNRSRVIRLGSTSLTYEHGKEEFRILYSQLKVIRPKGGVKNRTMLLSDGQHSIKVDEFFFPTSYEELLSDLLQRTQVAEEHNLG